MKWFKILALGMPLIFVPVLQADNPSFEATKNASPQESKAPAPNSLTQEHRDLKNTQSTQMQPNHANDDEPPPECLDETKTL